MMTEQTEENAESRKSEDKIAKKLNRKLKKPKDETSVAFFMNASLLLFFLLTYTFMLFLHKNRYPLILNDEVLPEVVFTCVGILIFTLVSLFAISWSRLLIRLWLSVFAGLCGTYILGLAYPDNVGVYYASWLAFLPGEYLQKITEYGNLASGIGIGLLFFSALNLFKSGAMILFSLSSLIALFLLLNISSKRVAPQIDATNSEVSAEGIKNEKTDNLIFLLLADHTGYKTVLDDWKRLFPEGNEKADHLHPRFIKDFYTSFGFSFHPAAYERFDSKYLNVAQILNPSLTEITPDLFSLDDASYYISADDAQIFPVKNDLFKEWRKKGYALNVYQTYPFNFCKDGENKIKKCVTYPAPLGALYHTNMTVPNRVKLLLGHFINSTPLGRKTLALLREKFKSSKAPYLFNPLAYSLPVGQGDVLYRLTEDVKKAKGKNIFFAHINLPHYPYVYDENCKLIENPVEWRMRAPLPNTAIELKYAELNRTAYMRQLACTYGHLAYMMNDLKDAKILDNTRVIVTSDSGDGIEPSKAVSQQMTRLQSNTESFKRNQATIFAYFDPKEKKRKIDETPCDVATLTNKLVMGKKDSVCVKPEMRSVTAQEEQDVQNWLKTELKKDDKKETKDFSSFYKTWLEKGGQAYIAELKQRMQNEDKSMENKAKLYFVEPPLEKKADNKSARVKKTEAVVPVPSAEPEVAKTEPAVPAPSAEPEDAKTEPLLVDLIAEEFSEQPKPVEIPETTAENKWKTTEKPALVKEEKNEASFDPDSMLQDLLTDENQMGALFDSDKDKTSLTEAVPDTVEPVVREEPVREAAPERPNDAPVENVAAQQENPDVAAQVREAERLKAEAEEKLREAERLKNEAEAKLKEQEQLRLAAEAKAKEEARLKAEAEAKAKEEARLKAEAESKAKEEARLKAEAEAKAKEEARKKSLAERKAAEEVERNKRIEKALAEAEARQKETEEREAALAAEREKRRAAIRQPQNLDDLDITTEHIAERVNQYGETETYIYIERKPNPKRKIVPVSNKRTELKQDLIHLNPEETELRDGSFEAQPAPALATETPAPAPATETSAPTPVTEAPIPVPATETSAPTPVTEAPAAVPANEQELPELL